MAIPTLNAISLEKLQTITNAKNSNILPLPMPTGDSDETEVFDMLGVTRDVTLTGIFVGITADIKAKIDAFEAICAGDQENSINFISDETGTIQVKIASVQTVWDVAGVSNKCTYTIRLIEGV